MTSKKALRDKVRRTQYRFRGWPMYERRSVSESIRRFVTARTREEEFAALDEAFDAAMVGAIEVQLAP